MLRDQLLEKSYEAEVRNRPLLECAMMLENAVSLSYQVEHALKLSKLLSGAAAVHMVAQCGPTPQKYRSPSPDSKNSQLANAKMLPSSRSKMQQLW